VNFKQVFPNFVLQVNNPMERNTARRNFIQRAAAVLGAAVTIPLFNKVKGMQEASKMPEINPIKSVKPLGFQWETADPFLFCVHHEDDFPEGNDQMGPDNSHFNGRHMGDDFIVKDGFRMYHGKTVPGFPGHPHRGFETITVVRKGLVDHADSMGAAGRYGDGDVQWMTAGGGVQHSEMFPLLHSDKRNPMELFQIWLNLPARNKMVKPHFKMFWRENIPVLKATDSNGKITQVEIIAGRIGDLHGQTPPPDSWASDPKNEVGVWNILMDAGSTWTLPAASAGINRTLYFYEGKSLQINGSSINPYHAIELQADVALSLTAGAEAVSILVLQGRPIGETVIQYGPFVMNSKAEIQQAFEDYHSTKFGGWPWSRYDQVHDRNKKRFAQHADGRTEYGAG
jgi:redox-sensitive bicupin YhaK (pirin superfamily)